MNSSIKQTSTRRTWQRKQQKATESRKEVQKVSEGSTSRSTRRRSEQEATNNTKRLWRLAEMTQTESFKINHEVANVTRSREILCSATTSRWFSREVAWRTSHDSQRTGHIGESEQRNGNADSSHQAAGLEQQSDQSTFEIQHSMSCGPVFESKQWQTRRTRLQRPRWRTWTANQFPKLRRGFRTHRPESRAGGERAVRAVG